MIRLTVEQVKLMHYYLIEQFGGQHGVRDEGLLSSALLSPFQTFDGVYLHQDTILRAASLLYSLINNHPFIDGNKRIGVTVMSFYICHNGYQLLASNQDLIELGLSVAQDMTLDSIITWLNEHTSALD